MTEEREIDLSSGSNAPSQRRRNRSRTNRPNSIQKTVSFIDAKGRVWTVEMHLPANTTMTTILQIAKSNISLMNNQDDVQLSDLVVLMEPKDMDETLYEDVGRRIVIFHEKSLGRVEGR